MTQLGNILLNKTRKNLKSDSNRSIVILAQKGNEHAMHQLYALYAKAMLNTAYRILNNREDAEDVLQESFIKAFRNLSSFGFESTFGAWLKRIVINHSINHLRKRRRLVFYDKLPEMMEEPKELTISLDEKKKLDILYAALHQLPDGYRTVFSLYVLEGYDHAEIGQILNIKTSTSISQLSRAKQKLRFLISKAQDHG